MSDAVPPSDETVPIQGSPSPPTGECAPIGDLARRTLRRRLRKTCRLITQLAGGCDSGPEFIHKFRVSCRRSEAALLTFRPLLPDGRSQRLRRRLKQLRKLAGEVRDVDVLLGQCHRSSDIPAFALDLASLRRSRVGLTKRLERRARREQRRRLKRSMRGVVRRVRWRESTPEPSVAAAAPALLRPIAQRCLTAAAQELRELRCLHQFRIHVKRVRYTCEFLETGLHRDASAALVAQLSELQQGLGQICDRAATVRLLEQSAAAAGSLATAAAIESLRRALSAVLSDFVAGWEHSGRDAFRHTVNACLAGRRAVTES